jgi:hypothetical protein
MHFHVAETRDFRPSNIGVYSTLFMILEYSPSQLRVAAAPVELAELRTLDTHSRANLR